MKRRRGFLSFVLMLVCIAGISAYPEYAPYGKDVTYYYGYLSREEQEVYDIIYEGVLEFRDNIEFPRGYDIDMVYDVVSLLYNEAPELFWLDNSWSASYYSNAPDVAVGLNVKYIMSEEEAIRRWKKIMAFHKSIEYSGDNELIDELALVQALMQHITYTEGKHVYDASAAIVKGEAVCAGYAKAATLLLRMHGIQCGYVAGIDIQDGVRGHHAWNIVRIGGEWTLLDVTWIDKKEASFYDWLNLSHEQFVDTHIPENVPSSYYTASDTYEVARILGLYCTGNVKEYFFGELDKLVDDDIPVLIYFKDKRLYEQLKANCHDWIREYNSKRGSNGFYEEYYTNCSDKRSKFFLDHTR